MRSDGKQKDWLIYTSCGVTFEERAPSIAAALKKSGIGKGFEIVAVVQGQAVVAPASGQPITVFIVGNKAAMKPVPEGFEG